MLLYTQTTSRFGYTWYPGHDKAIDQILLAVLSGGHVLLEGPPGVGKTLLARSLAKALELSFLRVQFTPDLMPTDILGVSIFNQKSGDFQFKKGPVFVSVKITHLQ